MAEYITLKNDRLEVKVQVPGTGYNFTRFDWSGIVEQVTLDGKHTYCSAEIKDGVMDPNGGVGITSCIAWMDNKYHDRIGMREDFPILGVGLLRKYDNIPYNFTKTYGCNPFKRDIKFTDTSVEMHTLPFDCHGVAVDEVKTITIEGNKMTIHHKFTNVGSETLDFKEYNHNFLKFDDHKVDSSYVCHMPYPLEPISRRGELVLGRDSYRAFDFDDYFRDICFHLNPPAEMRPPHWMKVVCEDNGLSVLIEENFHASIFWGWMTSDSFSPETNIYIHLEPGESVEYDRAYTFNA